MIRHNYTSRSLFPIPGVSGEMYVDTTTQRRYWWNEISHTYVEGFKFRINGVDIAEWIKANGIKWTRNDIDSSKAGRALSALMYRGRVAMKVKLEVSCVPLSQSQTRQLFQLIMPEFVTVEYVDPYYGPRTATFYSNNVPATYSVETEGGGILFGDISFPLVER